MKKKTLLSILIFITVFIVIINAGIICVSADDISAPEPYSIVLENGNKVLYITPMDDFHARKNENHPKSGLYYNENPPRNIYC